MQKQVVNTKSNHKHRKMDRYTVSSEIWELDKVRRLFYKMEGERIDHPTRADVLGIKKLYGKSRRVVYAMLLQAGWLK